MDTPQPQIFTPMPEERVLYSIDDVAITNVRAVFGAATYAVAGITAVESKSVALSTFPRDLAALGKLLIVVVAFFTLIGLVLGNNPSSAMGLLAGVALVWAGGQLEKRQKQVYLILLTTWGERPEVFRSPDKARVEDIVRALNEAMVCHKTSQLR
jgi:hypothetical protein